VSALLQQLLLVVFFVGLAACGWLLLALVEFGWTWHLERLERCRQHPLWPRDEPSYDDSPGWIRRAS
jgi:hypothetical protein